MNPNSQLHNILSQICRSYAVEVVRARKKGGASPARTPFFRNFFSPNCVSPNMIIVNITCPSMRVRIVLLAVTYRYTLTFFIKDMINVTKQENYSYKYSNKCHLWIKNIFAIVSGEKSYYDR